MYNPFKPHIVLRGDGTFAVRKFTLIGFVYLHMYDYSGKEEWHWFFKAYSEARFASREGATAFKEAYFKRPPRVRLPREVRVPDAF